ncbi:MAG TPA: glycosyltransferase family 9 protein [Candidatus Hydrogenedentes bacterium]|nr:glycosyltransferase family 9 protein [Candidatus Hydrogenedentota bacterium]
MSQPTDLYRDAYGGSVSRRIKPVGLRVRWHARALFGKPRRILVGLRLRLGDEIMALPIYGALKRAYPDCQLAVWCDFPDVLLDHPHVDAVNPREFEFDRFINLRGAPRDRYRISYYANQAGVPLPKSRPLLFYLDWSTPLLHPVLAARKPLVALCPGTSWRAKRWNLEFWRELGRLFAGAGYSIVELGIAEDPLIDAGVSLRGLTTVREAACILHAAKLAITVDSGLMHLALAADAPTIALFGPTAPGMLVRDEPRLTTLTNGRPCEACWNRFRMPDKGICPLDIPECPGTIRPETVFACAKRVLDGGG